MALIEGTGRWGDHFFLLDLLADTCACVQLFVTFARLWWVSANARLVCGSPHGSMILPCLCCGWPWVQVDRAIQDREDAIDDLHAMQLQVGLHLTCSSKRLIP
jgi:hypothetical protein